uniref:BZIP domain-containing protein n=1 Tax=Syphacia muris TaxID=451379 RepID=A0A0N5AQ16_9BILA
MHVIGTRVSFIEIFNTTDRYWKESTRSWSHQQLQTCTLSPSPAILAGSAKPAKMVTSWPLDCVPDVTYPLDLQSCAKNSQQPIKDTYMSDHDNSVEEFAVYIVRKQKNPAQVKKPSTVSKNLFTPKVYSVQESLPKAETHLDFTEKSCLVNCLKLPASDIVVPEDEQERLVPCLAMDASPCCTPEFLNQSLFEDDCAYENSVAFEENNFNDRSQQYSEVAFQDERSCYESPISDFCPINAQQQKIDEAFPTVSASAGSDNNTYLDDHNSFTCNESEIANNRATSNPPSCGGSSDALDTSDCLSLYSDLNFDVDSVDVTELDQYLNDSEDCSLRESTFSSIIQDDQCDRSESAVRVESVSNQPDTGLACVLIYNRDSSILNEFFVPIGRTQVMEASTISLAYPYDDTFVNVGAYVTSNPESVNTTNSQCEQAFDEINQEQSSAFTLQLTTAPSYKETLEYREKRVRNNIASQKSRLKRQNKFKMLKEEEVELKRRNVELKARVISLERQVQDVKDLIMKAIVK